MYAIVEIAGQQFKVEKGNKFFVNRLEDEEGSELKFDRVLLIDNEDKVTVGTPLVAKANVTAKVLQHVKGDTVLVFKKKRRKGYQTLNGHRQKYTEIEIQDINA
ncbi:MAG: 50S ribosomal protein L21 [Bacteroidales bacterium]|nr:50S ribosomal protein L21 [Bacteroidales bacterium]MDD4216235.1 50S ribosomal protein L21 [Bacteroidales bacterium]MDY0141393.1 50S ribosomal protein L21 [Bacteroidales bacterium]